MFTIWLGSSVSPISEFCSTLEPRTRRFSASFSHHTAALLQSPGSLCIPSRVSQLKQEETRDVAGREVASEKEFQSTVQITQSWDDLSLSDTDTTKDCKLERVETVRRPPSAATTCTEPIHVTLPASGLSPFVSSPYPSPTR